MRPTDRRTPNDDAYREVIRRVLERLQDRSFAPAMAPPVAAPAAGSGDWVSEVPPEVRGPSSGRWDEPYDESVGVASPTRSPGAGRCAGCTTLGACAWVCPATSIRMMHEGAERVGATLGARATAPGIAGRIDHTLLAPDATGEAIDRLCDEAMRYRFATVCVNGYWVLRCAERLRASGTPVCAVVGFPLGATLSDVKAAEAEQAVRDGASEIDMVLAIGALRSREYREVGDDIRRVVAAAGVPVKVILETALLTREQKIEACTLAKAAGAAFVKTSTGFGPSGATVDDVRLMRQVVGDDVSVKASGGVRDAETAQAMLEAGADRIGASASVRIAREGRRS
jgi:deoxyribose-phosphate aldolase